MPTEIWVALIGFTGVCLTVIVSIWIWRKTSQQTEKAAHQTEVVEADKTGIEGLRELALENRLDRAEWRQERTQMINERSEDRKRLDKLEIEVATLRRDLEARGAQIEKMKTERRWRIQYIYDLIDYIKRLGHQPPPPVHPVVLNNPESD